MPHIVCLPLQSIFHHRSKVRQSHPDKYNVTHDDADADDIDHDYDKSITFDYPDHDSPNCIIKQRKSTRLP